MFTKINNAWPYYTYVQLVIQLDDILITIITFLFSSKYRNNNKLAGNAYVILF